jgi:DNA-binding transcriptional LysR family regulator
MRTFVAVATELNYGRAAQRLHLTQPAVTQQIRLLEKDVGVELVDRSGRAISLTRAGEGFLPLCKETLSTADDAVSAALNAESSDGGVVRVGFAGALSTPAVAGLARSVRERYPGIELRITASHSSSGIMDLLQADGIDVGFTGMQRSVAGISTRLISSQKLGVVVASDHPLADEGAVALAELSDAAFVLTDLPSGLQLREQAIEACLDAGFRPKVVQEVPDTLTVLALVAAGIGIALLPSRFAEEAGGTVRFLGLTDIERHLRTVIAWRSSRGFGALSRVLEVLESRLPTPTH